MSGIEINTAGAFRVRSGEAKPAKITPNPDCPPISAEAKAAATRALQQWHTQPNQESNDE